MDVSLYEVSVLVGTPTTAPVLHTYSILSKNADQAVSEVITKYHLADMLDKNTRVLVQNVIRIMPRYDEFSYARELLKKELEEGKEVIKKQLAEKRKLDKALRKDPFYVFLERESKRLKE